MSDYFEINSWQDLNRGIDVMQRAGAVGTAHLLRALASGRIAMLPIQPEESASKVKAFARLTSHRPSIILIGDDDGRDLGPSRWSQARRAVRWARSVVIHGAGAQLFHYELAIEKAELVGRVLVVECSKATLPDWIALVTSAPHRPATLVISPDGDGPHPFPIRKEALH